MGFRYIPLLRQLIIELAGYGSHMGVNVDLTVDRREYDIYYPPKFLEFLSIPSTSTASI